MFSIKRGISVLLALVMVALALTIFPACQKEDESFLLARAEKLIEKSLVINRLFFYEGIPTLADAEAESGYLPADMVELYMLGFESVADIKVYMQEVFSPLLCGIMFDSYLFSPVYNGDMLVDITYCYDHYETLYGGEERFVGVYVSCEGLSVKTSPTEYHYETMHITSNKRDRVVISMVVTVYSEDGASQDTDLGVQLVKTESGIWLLDSYTAASYFTPPQM